MTLLMGWLCVCIEKPGFIYNKRVLAQCNTIGTAISIHLMQPVWYAIYNPVMEVQHHGREPGLRCFSIVNLAICLSLSLSDNLSLCMSIQGFPRGSFTEIQVRDKPNSIIPVIHIIAFNAALLIMMAHVSSSDSISILNHLQWGDGWACAGPTAQVIKWSPLPWRKKKRRGKTRRR